MDHISFIPKEIEKKIFKITEDNPDLEIIIKNFKIEDEIQYLTLKKTFDKKLNKFKLISAYF